MIKYNAVLMIIVLVVLVLMGNSYHECKEVGGTPVRGVFWIECL